MTLTNKIIQLLQDPENRKIVNDGQNEFECSRIKYSIKILYKDSVIGTVLTTENNFTDKAIIFCFVRYCIKLLPAFQEKNKELDKFTAPTAGNYNLNTAFMLHYYYTPKTLSEALLQSGAMTVEELEEEYKRLAK